MGKNTKKNKKLRKVMIDRTELILKKIDILSENQQLYFKKKYLWEIIKEHPKKTCAGIVIICVMTYLEFDKLEILKVLFSLIGF